MTAVYTEEIESAYTDILESGFVGEIRSYRGSVDIIEGTIGNDYLRTDAAMVTVPSVDSLIRFDEQFKETLASGKAKVFLVAAKGLSFRPKVGDYILYDSKLWIIGSGKGNGGLMPLEPSGTPIMFTVGCMVDGRDPSLGSEIV